MLDHYIYGRITRQSPEADVPVIDQNQSIYKAGGAANVALNILGLGGIPFLIGVIGNDSRGQRLNEIVAREGVDNVALISDSSRVTTCKSRILANDKHIARIDHEDRHQLEDEILERLLKQLEGLLSENEIDIAILQDYNKGLFDARSIPQIIALLNTHRVPFVVDPKETHFTLFKGASVFKPNLIELQKAAKRTLATEEDIIEFGVSLRQELSSKCLLITRGSDGLILLTENEQISVKALEVQDPDVCGAGDAVISLSALAYINKVDLFTLAAMANQAGALACKSIGVNPIRQQDII